MAFIYEQEMATLQAAYNRPEASLFVVYGLRRVGKTTSLVRYRRGDRLRYYVLRT